MGNNIKAAILGFVNWIVFLVIMRLVGEQVFSAGNLVIAVLYIACFPVGIGFTIAMRAIMNVPMRDMLQPMVIFAVVASLLDGFSFGFAKFYGTGPHEVYMAAFLLWIVGVFLMCTLWLVDREAKSGRSMRFDKGL